MDTWIFVKKDNIQTRGIQLWNLSYSLKHKQNRGKMYTSTLETNLLIDKYYIGALEYQNE